MSNSPLDTPTPPAADPFRDRAPAARPSKKGLARLMKFIRRMHLYTGLILLPWVIFFGFSGMLFNHPEFGAMEVVAELSPSENETLGALETLDPEALAGKVVSALNGAETSTRFVRESGNAAVIEGSLVFQGPAEGGAVTLSLDPLTGEAVISQVREAEKPGSPDFLNTPMPTAEAFEKERLQAIATELVAANGIKTKGPLDMATRGGAELRFRIESPETGQRWNLSWNPLGGRLNARELGAGGGPDLYTALTRFHKTHHYPERMGARWLWTAFGDATGLTMVFWGLSGAIMWWQMKPTRFLGVVGLSVAGVAAFYVFAGTYSNLHWVARDARPPVASAGKGAGPSDPKPMRDANPAPAPQTP